jgi:branched-subunit amino acid ABC-type transport system permease component
VLFLTAGGVFVTRSVRILTFIASGIFLFIGAFPLLFVFSYIGALFDHSLYWLGILMALCIFDGIMGIVCGIVLGVNAKAGRILLLVAVPFSGLFLSPYLFIYLGARKRNIQQLVEPLYPWQGSKTWPGSF